MAVAAASTGWQGEEEEEGDDEEDTDGPSCSSSDEDVQSPVQLQRQLRVLSGDWVQSDEPEPEPEQQPEQQPEPELEPEQQEVAAIKIQAYTRGFLRRRAVAVAANVRIDHAGGNRVFAQSQGQRRHRMVKQISVDREQEAQPHDGGGSHHASWMSAKIMLKASETFLKEQHACYHCRKPGHRKRNCPQLAAETKATAERAAATAAHAPPTPSRQDIMGRLLARAQLTPDERGAWEVLEGDGNPFNRRYTTCDADEPPKTPTAALSGAPAPVLSMAQSSVRKSQVAVAERVEDIEGAVNIFAHPVVPPQPADIEDADARHEVESERVVETEAGRRRVVLEAEMASVQAQAEAQALAKVHTPPLSCTITVTCTVVRRVLQGGGGVYTYRGPLRYCLYP